MVEIAQAEKLGTQLSEARQALRWFYLNGSNKTPRPEYVARAIGAALEAFPVRRNRL